MATDKISKKIHYCWFGKNPKPATVEHFISQWHSIMPEFEIMEWTEDNFPIETSIPYVKEAYENQKWAFVSDYVRLHALYMYGGIYLDTDVEVFQPFDNLLNQAAFFGFESKDYLTTAVMGCEKQHPIILEFMEEYAQRHFIRPDGSLNTATTNVVLLTRLLKKHGLVLNGKEQLVGDIKIYPQWFFSANDFINLFNKYRPNSYTYHHCHASWYDESSNSDSWKKARRFLLGVARNMVGTDILYRLRHGKNDSE